MLFWWIERINVRQKGQVYRYHVGGHMTDISFPNWSGNGREFEWTIPNLKPSGGRYVFQLKVI